MLDATEIIRRLALELKKPRGHIPRARSNQRGIFLLWRGIPAARAVFATAANEVLNTFNISSLVCSVSFLEYVHHGGHPSKPS